MIESGNGRGLADMCKGRHRFTFVALSSLGLMIHRFWISLQFLPRALSEYTPITNVFQLYQLSVNPISSKWASKTVCYMYI